MVFFSRGNSAISTFTYDGTPLELVTEFKYLVITLTLTLTRDGSMLTAAIKMADNFRSAIARVYRIGDSKVSSTENMPCYGFSRSLLWKLVFTVVKYGLLLLWHMIPQKSPPHMSFILASWKDSWVSRKALILTACSAKQVRCSSFSVGSDPSYGSGTVCSIQTILPPNCWRWILHLCRHQERHWLG